MTETANYKLKKPGYEDYADIEPLNANADIIDAELKKLDTGKAAAGHKHAASDITSGTIPVARGGTGLTASPSLLVNLASTAAASIMSSSPRPGVTGTLPVARGGTGVTSISALAAALESHLGSVKIAVGSYVGTDKYGQSNPNTLTFDFAPDIVMLAMIKETNQFNSALRNYFSDGGTILIAPKYLTTEYTQYYGFCSPGSTIQNSYGKKSADGKTIYWYNTGTAIYQMNVTSWEVFYIAIKA